MPACLTLMCILLGTSSTGLNDTVPSPRTVIVESTDDRENLLIREINPVLAASDTRILGGMDTRIEKYPFMTQVIYDNKIQCGGTIVTRKHIISCAHCFVYSNNTKMNPNGVWVRTGSSLPTSGGVLTRVGKITVHPKYRRPSMDCDIAILQLRAYLIYRVTQGPAVLAAPNTTIVANSFVTALGWGHTSTFLPAPILQEVTMRVVSHLDCAWRYSYRKYVVTENMICAGGMLDGEKKDACYGDSGGPLVHMHTVVGLTSWGMSCGNRFFPGVYTKVYKFISWINQNVERDPKALKYYNNSNKVTLHMFLIFVISVKMFVLFCEYFI